MTTSFPTAGNGNGNTANVTTQGAGTAAANLEITRNGNKIRVGNYEIEITKDSVKVRDLKTGKTFHVWGDPHLHTGDGDRMSFTENNITINLPGGVKLTIVPTEKDANGASWIDRVGIIAGDEGIMIHDVHGSPRFGQIRDAATVDATDDDGLLLHTGAEIDDFFSGDREFVGGDPNARWGEHDLDQLAQRGWLGSDNGNAMSGDKYDRLYAVLAKLEQMKERQLTRLGKLLDDKEEKDTLQAAKSEWVNEGNSAESFPGKARLEELSKANLESELKVAEMELQRTESLLTQTTTLISNLVANDGQTAMRIIGNIRMG